MVRSEYLRLVPVLALAGYIAFVPHLNYPYPVHVDEWVHLAFARAIQQAGGTTFIDPFLGQVSVSLGSNPEVGFHLFWGAFQSISGISWLVIFRYFPSIVFVISVLVVYILARRVGFGWEAAFLTSLMPTTVGVLGPGFLVPLAMGLAILGLCLFVAFNFSSVWSYLVLFILTSFILLIHAPTAVGVVVILIPEMLLNLKGNPKHSIGIALAVVVPFLVPFLLMPGLLLPTLRELRNVQPPLEYIDIPAVLSAYGYSTIGLVLLGTFILAFKGGKRNYSLVLGLLALLLMLVVFYTFHYGLQIMYTRGITYMALVLSIVAGAGLAAIKNLKVPEHVGHRLRLPSLVTENIGLVLLVVVSVFTLATSIPARLHTPYCRMIDSEDYEAFTWIMNNVDTSYDKAILDPWKATAFSAITGRHAYTRIHTAPTPESAAAYAFLDAGATDTRFLRQNGISIVYSKRGVSNPDLIDVGKRVYLLPPDRGGQ